MLRHFIQKQTSGEFRGIHSFSVLQMCKAFAGEDKHVFRLNGGENPPTKSCHPVIHSLVWQKANSLYGLHSQIVRREESLRHWREHTTKPNGATYLHFKNNERAPHRSTGKATLQSLFWNVPSFLMFRVYSWFWNKKHDLQAQSSAVDTPTTMLSYCLSS